MNSCLVKGSINEALKAIPEGAKRHKRSYVIATLLVISAFGPYIPGNSGIRVEHFVIYPLGFFALMTSAIRPTKYHAPKATRFVFVLLLFVISWTMAVTLLSEGSLPLARCLAALENYTQPAMLIILVNFLTSPLGMEDRQRLLHLVCKTICIMLCLNTLVALCSMYADVWPFVQHFVRGETNTGFSVWANSRSMGRLLGVFNQPMEAGLAYSFGLLSWLYLLSATAWERTWKFVLLAGLLIGGLFSVSKVFILGGLPVATLYFLSSFGLLKSFKPKRVVAFLVFLLTSVPVSVSLMNKWSGARYFLQLFDPEHVASRGLIDQFTAGRFGSEETGVKQLFKEVLQESPLSGFGFGLNSAIDNGYLEFFYQGGIVALSIYVFILLHLSFFAYQYYPVTRNESRLLATLMLICVFAGIGAPVLTMNRSSIILWTLMVLAISISDAAKSRTLKIPVAI